MPDEKIQIILAAKDMASAEVNKLKGNLGSLGSALGALGLGNSPLGRAATGLDAFGQKVPVVGKATQGLTSSIGGMIGPLAIATGATFVIADAAKQMGEFLGQAASAAIEENINIAKLGVSLRDNVPAFTANESALEAQIKSMEQFAFSADDIRNGLALLLPVTHNVTTAFTVEKTAMDLARLKNISLTDASVLLGKAFNGNTTALKRMGIQLTKGASGLTAIGEVAQVVQGQAAAFADTTAGKMEILTARIHDANVELGDHMIAPINGVANAALNMVPAVDSAASALGTLIDLVTNQTTKGDLQGFIDILNGLPDWFKHGLPGLDPVLNGYKRNLRQLPQAYVTVAGQIEAEQQASVDRQLAITQQQADETAATIQRNRNSYSIWQITKTQQEADSKKWQDLWNNSALAVGNDIVQGLKDAKSGAKNAMDQLMWAVKHPLALLQTEAKLKADLASKALADGLASQNPLIRARAEQTKAYLEGQIAQLDPYWAYQGAQASQSLSDSLSSEYPTIKSQARALVNQLNADFANLKTNYSIHVSSPGTNAGKNRYGGVALRAGGGPVDPGGTYIVGEKGPEVLHMGSGSGHITPNGAASQPIQIFLDGKKIFDVIDARMGKRLAMTSSASYTRG